MKYVMNSAVTRKQHGAVLAVSLLFLSIMTLVAVTGMKTSILDEKMSGNLRDSELAMQAAESAMTDAQTAINNFPNSAALTGLNGLLDREDLELDYLVDTTWDLATPGNYTFAPNLGAAQLAAPPRRIIKHMGQQNICTGGKGGLWVADSPDNTDLCRREVFRVTAHGTGLAPNTTKILQAYFARPVF